MEGGGRGPEDRGGRGGSLHPELVQGFATREDRLPVDELVLFDIDAERLGWSPAWPGACWRGPAGAAAWSRPAAASRPSTAPTSWSSSSGSAARPCAWWTRPCRWSSAASARRRRAGRLRQGPAHRPGRARAGHRDGAPWRPRRMVRRLHQPGRHRHPGPAGPGAPAIGLCNSAIGFQRRFAAQLEVAPERVELEHVGLNHLTWERAVKVDGVDRLPELLERHGPGWPATWACLWSCSRPSGSSPRPTSGTTTPPPRCSTSSGAAPRAPSRWPRSSGACSSCTATPGSTPSPSCWSGAAGPSTARPRPP